MGKGAETPEDGVKNKNMGSWESITRYETIHSKGGKEEKKITGNQEQVRSGNGNRFAKLHPPSEPEAQADGDADRKGGLRKSEKGDRTTVHWKKAGEWEGIYAESQESARYPNVCSLKQSNPSDVSTDSTRMHAEIIKVWKQQLAAMRRTRRKRTNWEGAQNYSRSSVQTERGNKTRNKEATPSGSDEKKVAGAEFRKK